MNQNIENKVIEIIAKQKNIDLNIDSTSTGTGKRKKVDSSSKFQDELDFDSLDVMDLVMAVEEEFNVQIPDSDVEKLKTVGDVVAYINEHKEVN